MGTILKVSAESVVVDAATVKQAYFRRNGQRKKDGYKPTCVYLLTVSSWASGKAEVVADPKTPGPALEYSSVADFSRYFDYWANLNYSGPIYPTECP